MSEIKNITKKQKRPYPLHKIEILVCLASVLHIINGIAWSIALSDWQYFERSGSIVVIIGILLAWRDVTGKIDWFKSYAISEIKAKLTESKNKAKGIVNSQVESEMQKEFIKYEKEVQILLDSLKKRIRTIEAIILITGTFLWGYGIVIGNFIYKYA